VDSRPSDAIAISVQFGTPIFVEEKVFEEVSKDEEQLGGEPRDLDEEGEEEEK
jgi:bifunctional DNase/RNase